MTKDLVSLEFTVAVVPFTIHEFYLSRCNQMLNWCTQFTSILFLRYVSISVGANVFPWDFHEESKPHIFWGSLGIKYDEKY